MEDFLSMDNILTGDEAANLFTDFEDDNKNTPPESQEEETKNETNNSTEVDPEELFEEESTQEEPESVGSEDIKEGKEKDTTSSEEDGASPETNFYSSIASALKEEGVFPDLEDNDIDGIKEPEDFRDLIERQIQAGLDEAQKRIYSALNAGVEPSEINKYENTLKILDSITDERLEDESSTGENLRRQLLMQDFLNRGYSQERAVKMTEKMFASGEDIEEAKQALLSNKEFYQKGYSQLLKDAKEREEQEKRELRKQNEQLKKDILNGSKVFGSVDLDKSTRQKVYDNIAKPVYKDPETGEMYTAIQKYRLEHENDFIRNVGLLFTLTDGFTNLDKLVSPSAKKEVKKKLRDLEHSLKGGTRVDGGPLKYVGAGKSTSKSFLDQGYMIDIK